MIYSALEYGASNFKSSSQYNGSSTDYYNYSNVNSVWGVHLNFVHEIFYNKTADWLKLYTGPTINSIKYADLGYGVILGAEMKIKGRLKFDARYELSTQTNQIRAGLIYKYQKKYLWQR
jgi:opacity protein-like surface antigen